MHNGGNRQAHRQHDLVIYFLPVFRATIVFCRLNEKVLLDDGRTVGRNVVHQIIAKKLGPERSRS